MRNCWVSGRCVDNSGLLVMVIGRLIDTSPDGFVIDDGTVPGGLAMRCLVPFPIPEVGRLVRVEGISTPNGVLVCLPGDVVELD
jgi:hypothetical protein